MEIVGTLGQSQLLAKLSRQEWYALQRLNIKTENNHPYYISIQHTEEFEQWLNNKEFTPHYKRQMYLYFSRLFAKKDFATPLEMQSYVCCLPAGKVNAVKSIRNYFNYCEEHDKLPSSIIDKYRKVLKVKRNPPILYIPELQEILNDYAKVKDHKGLRNLYLVLFYSGCRVIEAMRFLHEFDIKKGIVKDSIIETPLQWHRTNKSVYSIYLPLQIYNRLERISNTYTSILTKRRKRQAKLPMKYMRKFHYNLMIENNVPESVADFIQGRTPKTISAAHYLGKVKQARIWCNRLWDKVGELLPP